MKKLTEHDTAAGIKKVAELIKGIRIAMLTTVDPDGELRSRPMAMQENEFDGALWFFTAKSSGKMDSVLHDQHVNLAFSDPSDSRYVSLTGQAVIVDDKVKARELWNPMMKSWFPKGLEDPELTLLKVDVSSAEYWDTPSGKMATLIGFSKVLLTGQQADVGENQKIELRH
jgi:general stress protein 26